MSLARFFNGGAARRAASRATAKQAPAAQPATPPVTEASPSAASDEGRIAARLDRYSASAVKGLASEFVPETLESLAVSPRVVSLEQVEGKSRPE